MNQLALKVHLQMHRMRLESMSQGNDVLYRLGIATQMGHEIETHTPHP